MADHSPPAAPAGEPGAAPADPRAGLFDITLEFTGNWTESLQAAVLEAACRIEAAVVGELPDAVLPTADGHPIAVDDLLIRADLPAVDGVGGAFGFAGPTAFRADSLLPFAARMVFDEADATELDARGAWGDVVLHEMIHCLGFGLLWGAKGLVAPGGGGYIGPAGVAEYAASGGTGPVPIELGGGVGTAGLHWSEQALGDELMTGYFADAGVLSPLTVASLADLGYGLAPREAWALDAAHP